MMDNPDYKKIIRELMGDYRYEHSVNVADEAVTLAELYGGDVDKEGPVDAEEPVAEEILPLGDTGEITVYPSVPCENKHLGITRFDIEDILLHK